MSHNLPYHPPHRPARPATNPPTGWDLIFTPTVELEDGQRWSTWSSVDAVQCHGPRPYPDWVITDDGAVDTELGIVKTGKEADVFLLERGVPDDPGRQSLLAAKRYRNTDHRMFTRDGDYTAGRRLPKRAGRELRAMAKKTDFGKQVAAGQWARAEFDFLKQLYVAGVPVPYPVQLDGTEILMEYIHVDGNPAPRLVQVRPDRDLLRAYFEQTRAALATLARLQVAHGDLSPYNVLCQGERLVVIDVPQVVDLVSNPRGVEFLHRDCVNMCAWFAAKGLEADPDVLLADLLAQAW